MRAYSILDLASVPEGADVAEALDRSRELAQQAEALGFKRFWMAEHHGMEGIASAATAVALTHVGQGTKTIRLGAGGIMLPNHAPFLIAEQFGTLEALFAGRIDLGLGRAPGSDQAVARMVRRGLHGDVDQFPNDVLELQALFAGDERLPVQATPGRGARLPLYILGSSLFGAKLAAALGLPYAFASHFAPQMLDQALAVYRDQFQPSEQLAEPYVICGYNIYAADTDAEAEYLASSMLQSFERLRTGQPGKMPPPIRDYRANLSPQIKAMADGMAQGSAIGSAATVREQVAAFLQRTGADELIIGGAIFDRDARAHSMKIAADILDSFATATIS